MKAFLKRYDRDIKLMLIGASVVFLVNHIIENRMFGTLWTLFFILLLVRSSYPAKSGST